MIKLISSDCFGRLKRYFNGDTKKVWEFMKAKNPHLGGVSPLEMIRAGREKKLIDFINSYIGENYR